MRLRRRKQLVRLHLHEAPSIGGILAGKVAGHYRLLRPVAYEGEERSRELEGEVWIPVERVLFLQVFRG